MVRSAARLLCALCFLSPQLLAKITPMIIGGTPAPLPTWQEVVNLEITLPGSRTGVCSATIVGKRVLITAAHCGSPGAAVKFKFNGSSYSGTFTRSSLYPGRDHDVALVLVSTTIASVTPRTIGGKAVRGNGVDILGYGCTTENGSPDGKLYIGQSVIAGFSGFYAITNSPDGAAACRGDSGGPIFVTDGSKKLLVGVNSLGNGTNMSYHARLDSSESVSFLEGFARDNSVDICGVSGVVCSDSGSPDPAPSCTLTASPSSVTLGQAVTLSMVSANATRGFVDGNSVTVPTWQSQVTTSRVGRFTISGEVQGAGGSSTCTAFYEVVNGGGGGGTRPTCTLVAIPKQVQPNQDVALELTVNGTATTASIDGVSVTPPVGRITVRRAAEGDYAVTGYVKGSGGSANCFTDFKVTKNTAPPPAIPDYAVTPSHCGPNTSASSSVKVVCLAVVKKPDMASALLWNQVVQITNDDGTVEVLPIVSVQNSGTTQRTLSLYLNRSLAVDNYRVLDTKGATLTVNSANVPQSIEGRSSKGAYYLVNSLSASSVSTALANPGR